MTKTMKRAAQNFSLLVQAIVVYAIYHWVLHLDGKPCLCSY